MKSYAAHNRPLKAGRKPQVRPQPKDPQMINKMDFFNPMKLGEKLDDWEYESGDSSSIATLLRLMLGVDAPGSIVIAALQLLSQMHPSIVL